jgi:3-isopropylmalate/(R)-2-methylmalate dehydratase small subunit
MEPFTAVKATACPLPLANVDTDQLIPARFMSRSRASGYGDYLLHGHRFDENGAAKPGCPLNDLRYSGAQALVALRNFGSGSSREAAVYALVDYGFRCVIAPSFGDIFASNAVNNGLVPAQVSEADAQKLITHLEQDIPDVYIDLNTQSITAGALVIGFAIDPVWRMKLLNGWDDLDLTLSFQGKIDDFFAQDSKLRPWVSPRRSSAPNRD